MKIQLIYSLRLLNIHELIPDVQLINKFQFVTSYAL